MNIFIILAIAGVFLMLFSLVNGIKTQRVIWVYFFFAGIYLLAFGAIVGFLPKIP